MSGISGAQADASMQSNGPSFHSASEIPYMEASTILERLPALPHYTEEVALRTTNGNTTPSSSGASTPVEEPTPTRPARRHTNQVSPPAQVLPSTPSEPLILLNVDGMTFEEHRTTLSVSPALRALINHWEASGMLHGGIHWIDADPTVFEHILCFMRRGSTYPLLWTLAAGFDYAMYNRLLAAATQFELWDLRDWIASQRYLGAVTSTVRVETLDEPAAGQRVAMPQAVGGTVAALHTHMATYPAPASWVPHQCTCPCLDHDVFRPDCIACETACVVPGYGAFDATETRLTLVTTTIQFHPEVCAVERERGRDE